MGEHVARGWDNLAEVGMVMGVSWVEAVCVDGGI